MPLNAGSLPSLQNVYKPPRIASTAVVGLAVSKVLLGISCIVAPRFSGRLFLLDVPRSSYIVVRLFGSGVGRLGGSLLGSHLTANSRQTTSDMVRPVLVAKLVADSVDVISCTASFASGSVGASTFTLLGGGCVILVILGLMGMRGV